MPSPDDDSEVPWVAEPYLRETILAGMDEALRAIGKTDGEIDRYFTDTKREKLLQYAIVDLNLPLTYSFYLAGGCTVVYSTGNLPTREPHLDRPPEPVIETEFNGDLDPFVENSLDPKVEQYKEYFLSELFFGDCTLKEVFHQDKHDFLLDYYQELLEIDGIHLDEDIIDLYITVTNFRRELESLTKDLDTTASNTSLTEFGVDAPGIISRNKELKIRDYVSLIHMKLAGQEEFNGTLGPVKAGTDLIEKVVKKLTLQNEVATKQRQLINELNDFFYDFVWKYPALRLSIETATGPNADKIISKHQETFADFDDKLLVETARFEADLREAGMVPDVEDYIDNEYQEAREEIHRLTRSVVRDE